MTIIWQKRSLSVTLSVDDLSLKLQKLGIDNQEIKRASNTKYLAVPLDENLSWKKSYTENKTTERIGLMSKVKHFLHNDSLVSLHFSYIHFS